MKPLAKHALALVFAAAALASPGVAAAQSVKAPTYPGLAFGSAGGEALLAFGSALSLTSVLLPARNSGWGPDSEHVHDPVADMVSNFTGAAGGSAIAMVAGYGFEAAYFGDQQVRNGPLYALREPLVELESATLATGTVMALKRLTGRCRPRYFHGGVCEPDSLLDAFPSGHTSPIAAVAAARLLLAIQTESGRELRWTSFGVAEGMAIGTAFLRVRAGMHSWTDVAGGFVLGHLVGLLVAAAHPLEKVSPGDRTATASSGLTLSWSGSF